MKRHLSLPLLELLTQASLHPNDLDAALDLRARQGTCTHLQAGHAFLRQIVATTGINVVDVGRRSRRLFMTIDQHASARPAWRYVEINKVCWRLLCEGCLPDTLKSALSKAPVSQLIQPTPAIAGASIEQVRQKDANWLEVTITPQWQEF